MAVFYGGFIGTPELIIILLVAVLLFGGNRVSHFIRKARQQATEIKKASEKGLGKDLKDTTGEIEQINNQLNRLKKGKL